MAIEFVGGNDVDISHRLGQFHDSAFSLVVVRPQNCASFERARAVGKSKVETSGFEIFPAPGPL